MLRPAGVIAACNAEDIYLVVMGRSGVLCAATALPCCIWGQLAPPFPNRSDLARLGLGSQGTKPQIQAGAVAL
jgi:hypothetical protein